MPLMQRAPEVRWHIKQVQGVMWDVAGTRIGLAPYACSVVLAPSLCLSYPC